MKFLKTLVCVLVSIKLCLSLTLELEEIPSLNLIDLTDYWKTHQHPASSYQILQQSKNERHKGGYVDSQNFYSDSYNPVNAYLHEPLINDEWQHEALNRPVAYVTLRVPIQNQIVDIYLKPKDLTHPDISISRYDGYEGYSRTPMDNRDCFLSGTDDNGAWAVLSVCTNLMGMLSYNGLHYHIEEVDLAYNNVHDGARLDAEWPTSPIYLVFPLEDNLEKYLAQPILAPEEPVYQGPKRFRRRTNTKSDYTVEIAVFVDQSLYKYVKKRFPNQDQDYKTVEVVMTLINAVHLMYDSSTLGKYKVKMQVKKIQVLGTGRPHHKDGDIYSYLKNFCEWQMKYNSQDAAEHWDHAMLLTGHDLWSKSKKHNSTVGLAYVEGMCTMKYTCIVNEAISFAAAFIIAHELGHNMGMRHDGGNKKDCEAGKYLMSPVMTSGATKWSKCSKDQLVDFLKRKGGCLRKTPLGSIKGEGHAGELPGLRFNAEKQCNYMYGPRWSYFTLNKSPFNKVCQEIWCKRGQQLRTPSAPALEGTKCGVNKVCSMGSCINYSKKSKSNSSTTKKAPIKNTKINRINLRLLNDDDDDKKDKKVKETKDKDSVRPGGDNIIHQIGGVTPPSTKHDDKSPSGGCKNRKDSRLSKIFGQSLSDFFSSFFKVFGYTNVACDVKKNLNA